MKKAKCLRLAHSHYYASGKIGILRTILKCDSALRPVSLTVGHESYPLLDESDEIEYQHVVLAALAATADEIQVTFCAPIPNINRNDAWCFRFAPNRPPVQVSIPASPVASRGRPQ